MQFKVESSQSVCVQEGEDMLESSVQDEVSVDSVVLPVIYVTGPIASRQQRALITDIADALHERFDGLCTVISVVDVEEVSDSFEKRMEAVGDAEVLVVCLDEEGSDADVAVEVFHAHHEAVSFVFFTTDGTVNVTAKVYTLLDGDVIDLSYVEREEQVDRLAEAVTELLNGDDAGNDDASSYEEIH